MISFQYDTEFLKPDSKVSGPTAVSRELSQMWATNRRGDITDVAQGFYADQSQTADV